MKRCNRCEIEKTPEEFLKDKRNKNGLQSVCAECSKILKKEVRLKRLAGELPINKVVSKICTRCHCEKKAIDFFADNQRSDGLSSTCKDCKNERTSEWRENNREKYNAKMRAYNEKHYERLRLLRYKLSVKEHAKMLAEQNGACKICLSAENGTRPLAVDHCHDSGKVRSLLCYACNRAIAILDNPELLKQALAYLESSKATSTK